MNAHTTNRMGAHAANRIYAPTINRRWTVLVLVSLGLLMVSLDNTILYTALPTVTADLQASASEGLWIINAYPLVMAGLLLGAGTLGDKYGHKRLFIWGLVIFGLASLTAALASTAALLIAGRALLGVGAAMVMPATLALIRQTFSDERERSVAISVWSSVALIGAATGPIVAGLLLESFPWGSVFLINIPIVVIGLIGGVILIPASAARRDTPWDGLSSLLALAGLASLVYFIKEVAKAERDWLVVAAAIVIAVVGLTLFVRRQDKLVHPLLDFAIFRSRALSSGALAAGLALFAIAGLQLITTQRFQLAEEFTPLEAGLLVSCIVVGALPAGLVAGAIMHRTGPAPLIVGGLTVGTLGLVGALVLLPHGVVPFGVALGVTGLGLGAVMTSASSAVIGNVSANRAGMASSVEEVSYEFGSLTAVAVIGSVFTTLSASMGMSNAYNIAVIVCIAALGLGAVAAAVMLRGVEVQQGH